MTRIAVLLALIGAFSFPTKCRSQDQALAVYGGVNGVWFDAADAVMPSDFELGGTARLSLSPRIALVGSGWYGLEHIYARGAAGARITSTDVNNPNFSIGIGFQRHFSNDSSVRPNEWAPDASLGWRPRPDTMPRLVLALQGSWGLDSKQAQAIAGLRYQIGGRP